MLPWSASRRMTDAWCVASSGIELIGCAMLLFPQICGQGIDYEEVVYVYGGLTIVGTVSPSLGMAPPHGATTNITLSVY
jgi:hypothetical protein